MPQKCNNENYTTEQLNRDLDSLYAFCKENNLSDEEIKELCGPLLKLAHKAKMVKYLKFYTYFLVVATFCYVLCSFEIVSWNLSAIGRILMIKLLPYYDWTVWKQETCLIPKFGGQNNQINEVPNFDCVLCESVTDIHVKDNVTQEMLYENYIELHVPIILTKPEIKMRLLNQSIDNVAASLISNKILAESIPCKLSTNIYNGADTLDTLLERTGHFNNFFLHYQNCDFGAVKNFRLFSARPSFLDPAKISPIQYSWLLMNRNYNVSKFKSVDLQERITVVLQTLGGTVFNLIPQTECEFDCHTLNFELKIGQALIFTSLWNLEYKPLPKGENVALILEAH